MIAEVLALEALELGVLRRSQAERGLGNFGGEDGVFALFADAALFPFVGEFIADGDGAHPLFNPVIGIALGLVKRAGALGGELRVFDLLDALIADPGKPAFEGLGLGAGNGLDQAEDAFGVPALKQLASAGRVEFEAKGGDKLSPSFESVGQKLVALAELFQIVAGINGVGQHGNDIRDNEPPFVVVNRAADFLALKQGEARTNQSLICATPARPALTTRNGRPTASFPPPTCWPCSATRRPTSSTSRRSSASGSGFSSPTGSPRPSPPGSPSSAFTGKTSASAGNTPAARWTWTPRNPPSPSCCPTKIDHAACGAFSALGRRWPQAG